MTTTAPARGVVVDDLPADEYHAHPALSSSGARKLLPPSCPAKFKWDRDNGQPHKAEFDLGHAAHTLALGVGPEIVTVPFDNWRTNASKDMRDDAYAQGKVPLLVDDAQTVLDMAAALRNHPVAAALLEPDSGLAEQSLFWTDPRSGVHLRARLDWLRHPTDTRMIVTDYKTTTSAQQDAVEKAIDRWGYYMQGPWYVDAVRALGLADDKAVFVLIFQEKTPPYLVGTYQLDLVSMQIGAARNRQAIDIFQRCAETDTWPGYSDRVELATLPAYTEKRYIQELGL